MMRLPDPAGARWHKFEFHCHTPASDDYGKGPNQATLKQRTPREWLLDYMAAGIDCLAVTDHNSGQWIDPLKHEYERMQSEKPAGFRPLTIFPGVEISAQNGVHVLAILDSEKGTGDITHLLGLVEFHGEPGRSGAVTKLAAAQVCERIGEAGGVAILAHVDKPSGAFYELHGQTLLDLLRCRSLLAIEIVGKQLVRHNREAIISPSAVEQSYDTNPDVFRSFRAIDQQSSRSTRLLAEVLGSDSHHPSGEAGMHFPGSHYTWVKMGPRPNLEGLMLALHDDAPLSIRRSDSCEPHDETVNPNLRCSRSIELLSVENAQFCGRGNPLIVQFSPRLNCIVGGRGSGKSTLVELARLALRRGQELTGEPKSVFDRFAKVFQRDNRDGALTAETEIKLAYQIDGVLYRLRWRQDGKQSSIEECLDDGSWRPTPGEVTSRFPVRIYSQKQVYELSRDTTGLLKIIDESREVGKAEWMSRWRQEEARYFALKTEARELEASLSDETRIRGELDELNKKLQAFAESGHADILRNFQRTQRQKVLVDDLIEESRAVSDRILLTAGTVASPSLDEQTFKGATGASSLLSELETLRSRLSAVREDLARSAEVVKEAVKTFQQSVPQSEWGRAVIEANEQFVELKRKLAAAGASDPNDYGRLMQQRQAFESELKKLEGRKQHLESIRLKFVQSRRELFAIRRELTAKRRDFLRKIVSGNEFVRIEIVPYGEDIATVEDQFRSIIGKESPTFAKDILQVEGENRTGLLAQIYEDYLQTEESNTARFEERLFGFPSNLKMTALTGAKDRRFADHILAMRPEQFDRLESWIPEDSLRVEYSNGKGGPWRPIGQGSPGQKTAAMLAFLLSYGEEPMILDQPEDDLDNHLIYDLIVRQIRENKTRRQLIVVTHNSNVVVNGDAELVIAMAFKDGQCQVATSGCLQERAVRDEVCRVMEGGREAFENRYRRVILENS